MNRKQRRAVNKISANPSSASALPISSQMFAQAVQFHQSGRLAEAEETYHNVLRVDPTHAEAWSNLGLALRSRDDFDRAVAAYRRAIVLRPNYLEPHLNLIDVSQALGDREKAIFFTGRVVAIRPEIPEVHNNLGVLLQEQGRIPEAVVCYHDALRIRPEFADAYSNLGMALHELGRNDEAIEACNKAIHYKPGYAEAYSNLGGALRALGRHSEAIDAYRQAIEAKSSFAGAYSNLGMALTDLGQIDEAVEACRKACELKPGDPEALCNLGTALQKQSEVKEALATYRKAVVLKPGYASPYSNLGMGLHEENKFEEAIAALHYAIRLKPDYAEAISEYVQMRRHICDWADFETDQQRLFELIGEDKPVASFILLASSSSPHEQLVCAKQSISRMPVPAHAPFVHQREGRHDKIRVGYLSIDFRDHPVGRLMPEMFSRHDRNRFEISAYSYCPDDSGPTRQRLRAACDHFIDIREMSHVEAAELIHRDGIDILIDLTGRTLGARTEIMALRPAPVEVSFIGYPGTMGTSFIDYVIADPFLVPFDQQPFYTEKIVHLPDCYQPSDTSRVMANPPPTRADCGLPADGFVFCTFNNTYKITPPVFDSWMRILQQTPHSVLWLYCKTPQTIANLQREAEARGVSANRLVFTGFAQMEVFLARLNMANLFLDSTPYNAGATCNDALWAGLPVLTCVGETYVGRMAGSLLNAVGLPELVTKSLADYEAMAIRLANDPALYASLRQRLWTNRSTAPLFDMARYTRHLDAAFATMAERWRSGQAPAPFAVPVLAGA
jgi:predicted O-linked N-acetylglucosamine transferase (SPINDLY family)